MKILQMLASTHPASGVAPAKEVLFALCENGRIVRKDLIDGPESNWVALSDVPSSLFNDISEKPQMDSDRIKRLAVAIASGQLEIRTRSEDEWEPHDCKTPEQLRAFIDHKLR